jgi:PAS domain-containing protein
LRTFNSAQLRLPVRPEWRQNTFDTGGFPASMFEDVVRAANVAYYEWQPTTGALRFNRALLNLLGYDPNAWTQSTAWDSIHPDDRPGYRSARIRFREGTTRGSGRIHMANQSCQRQISLDARSDVGRA